MVLFLLKMDDIKEFKWENRVFRTGFLQSKLIVCEATTNVIKLSDSVSVNYENMFWVKDINLYDDERTKGFVKDFDLAFQEDKEWPKKIFFSLRSRGKKLMNLLWLNCGLILVFCQTKKSRCYLF